MIDRVGGGLKDYAPLMLRLGLATIFILQGASKVGDLGRSPALSEIVVMSVELLGGLFCLIGFMTRWAAFSLGALMAWVIFQHERFHVLTREADRLPFACLVMCAALYGLGGGKHSLDDKQKKKDG